MMKPKLTIYDEPLLYAEGLSKLLVQAKIFSSIEICNSYENLSEHIEQNLPEFLMISSGNLVLTEMYSSIENIITKNKNTKIIVIGNSFDVATIRKLFNKGIKSFLDRNSSYDEFLKSIQALMSNEIYICEYAKEMMINYISHEQEKQNSHIKDPLTKREMEILKHICNGLSSKDISELLFISINTVETHRKRILLKLNVKNSVGVVKYAIENKIFS